jgi:hypothetical protein
MTDDINSRRDELLSLARKSRRLWIFECADKATLSAIAHHLTVKTGRKGVFGPGNQIPGSECLQSILDHLNELCGDDQNIIIESLLPVLDIADDEEDEIDLWRSEVEAEPESKVKFNTKSEINTKANDTVNSMKIDKSPYDSDFEYPEDTDPYVVFIDKLRHNDAAEIVSVMQHFARKIKQLRDPNQNIVNDQDRDSESSNKSIAGLVWSHIEKVLGLMRKNPLWKNVDGIAWTNCALCLERFVFTKLRTSLFSYYVEDDIADRRYAEHLKSLDFIGPESLSIPNHIYPSQSTSSSKTSTHASAWRTALAVPINELQALHSMFSPSQMHAAIKRCTLAIGALLRDASHMRDTLAVSTSVSGVSTSSSSRSSIDAAYGADDFLPHLILAIREAIPEHIHSCLRFLEHFTQSSKLNSEPGYLLTQLVSAVHFLDTLDADSVHMDARTFQQLVAESKLRAKERANSLTASITNGTREEEISKTKAANSSASEPPAPVSRPAPSIHDVSRARRLGLSF